MECLICKDTGTEPLQDITNCTCKYQCHNSCWIDYVNSQHNLKCAMCRRVIKLAPKTNSGLFSSYQFTGTAPNPSAPSQEPYSLLESQITVEEFRIAIGLPPVPESNIPLMSSRTTQPTSSKKRFSEMNRNEKAKFICGVACIIAVVVITIVVIATIL